MGVPAMLSGISTGKAKLGMVQMMNGHELAGGNAGDGTTLNIFCRRGPAHWSLCLMEKRTAASSPHQLADQRIKQLATER